MIDAMLMMIGGCLMMLGPLLHRPLTQGIEPTVGYVLREAFSAEPYLPAEMRHLIQRIH